jgi:phage terminase small subunit
MKYREQRFIDEYLVDADPTKAALRAGYKPNNAKHNGAALLRKATVRYAIDRLIAERAQRLGLTRERVLLEYARVAFGNLGRVARWGGEGVALAALADLSDDDAAAIAGLVCGAGPGGGPMRVRLHDKGFALEALAQYFGLYDHGPAQDETHGARERLLARIDALAPKEA